MSFFDDLFRAPQSTEEGLLKGSPLGLPGMLAGGVAGSMAESARETQEAQQRARRRARKRAQRERNALVERSFSRRRGAQGATSSSASVSQSTARTSGQDISSRGSVIGTGELSERLLG